MTATILIVNSFAAVWAIAGLLALNLSRPLWAIPILLSAAVAAWCLFAARDAPRRTPEQRRHVARVVGLWSAVEGILFVIVANVLLNTGLSRDILPALAIIVGLHFFPLARFIPSPLYDRTGTVLLILGLAGLVVPPRLGSSIVGFGAALTLWLSLLGSVAAGGSTPAAMLPGSRSGRMARNGETR